MPWLPMYLYRDDIKVLLDKLNDDSEIAFIVPVGEPEREHRWKAVERVESLPDGAYELWHVPSGSLPLIKEGINTPDGVIPDPWAGWREQVPGEDPKVPFFGSHPNVIGLELHERGNGEHSEEWRFVPPDERSGDVLGMSDFGWIGQRYRAIGQAASASTERWWRRLRRWVAKNATKIPRYGPVDGPDPEIYAFPCALEAIRQGKSRDGNVY